MGRAVPIAAFLRYSESNQINLKIIRDALSPNNKMKMYSNNMIKCFAKTITIRNTFAFNDIFPSKYFHVDYSRGENPRSTLKL